MNEQKTTIETKTCERCGKETKNRKKLNNRNWRRVKYCAKCRKKRRKEIERARYERNKEQILYRQKMYNREHPECQQEYRQRHREHIRAWGRRYYARNRKKMLAMKLAWFKRNPEKAAESQRKYQAKNREKFRLYMREYYREHRDKMIKQRNERLRKKRKHNSRMKIEPKDRTNIA